MANDYQSSNFASSLGARNSDHNSNDVQAQQHETAPYLDQSQQSLLLAALNPQLPQHVLDDSNSSGLEISGTTQHIGGDPLRSASKSQEQPHLKQEHTMDTQEPTFTPDLLDLDDSFDFDNADLGGSMIGGMPDYEDDDEIEQHEKRKAVDNDDGNDAKRQEASGLEKGAKKPGRKPLTSEPTTVSIARSSSSLVQHANTCKKRKAQNRAAQRAFRERKEAHLKDLETKVSELTKAQEADKHENGLLKAQVSRLQTELREYRKRLSSNGAGARKSPTLAATQTAQNTMGFQFDFPKFGSLPTASLMEQANNTTPPLSTYSPSSTTFTTQNGQISRHSSENRSMSPTAQNQNSATRNSSLVSSIEPNPAILPYSTSDNMHGFASTLPQMGKSSTDPFGDLFSPSILKSVNQNKSSYFAPNTTTNDTYPTNNGGDSTAGIPDNRVFRFNSTSIASDTASPSTSSLSRGNTANSSCGTSPEPISDSPATKLKSIENNQNNHNQYSFTQLPTQSTNTDVNYNSPSDLYNVPKLETFDPVLFGDYRDTNESIVGDGDFTGGFFDDSFNTAPLDWDSPSNLFGIVSPAQQSSVATPSHNLMAEIDKTKNGGDDDYGLPNKKTTRTDKPENLISCTKIWSQLQSNPDFGNFDLDNLCQELRTKARCSESGLMVDADHVDAALKKLNEKGYKPPSNGGLMFEQQSWDNVLRKLNSGKQ